LAADRFAAFGSEEFEPDGFDIGSQIESFDIKRERRQLQGAGIQRWLTGRAHTSDSVCGNFS